MAAPEDQWLAPLLFELKNNCSARAINKGLRIKVKKMNLKYIIGIKIERGKNLFLSQARADVIVPGQSVNAIVKTCSVLH